MINKIIISLAFLFLYGAANAQTWNIGTPNAADVTATLSNGTLTISGTGQMQNFIMFNTPWENYKNQITHIAVGDGVEEIGNNAFYGFTELVSVSLPNTLNRIGNYAFAFCTKLTSITIPASVMLVGTWVFHGNTTYLHIINRNPVPQYLPNDFSVLPTLANYALSVPCGSLEAYKNTAVWQNFGTIEEDCPPKAGTSNVQANFSCPGQVSITYDLNTTEPVDATLYYSHNKHDWLVAQTVTGDLTAQSSGTGKTIIWNNVADNVKFGKFYFKVVVPLPEPEPECVTIGNACWATRNVGAPGTFVDKPEDFGMFYQWNSKVGWSSTDPPVSTDGSVWDSSWNGNGATTWETANNVCPTGFRVPTKAERQSLADAENKWTSLNGVSGRLFGSGSNTIFLPAAGLRNLSDGVLILIYGGSDGAYWSSNTNMNAYCLYFNSIYALAGDNLGGRSAGHSVRCVKE